jgi:NADH:ubiquinone oxidoreductase subunit 5 (subunit L)/multisubunit Na+/H+ antiporter MnhA subunit
VRCSPILEYSPTALLVITLIGSITAFVAATCGLVQNDIKRIIAFSTISQLGLIRGIILILIYLYFLKIYNYEKHITIFLESIVFIRFSSHSTLSPHKQFIARGRKKFIFKKR